MSLFCTKCESLLDERFENGLEYICTFCGQIYQSSETDIIEETFSTGVKSTHRLLLELN